MTMLPAPTPAPVRPTLAIIRFTSTVQNAKGIAVAEPERDFLDDLEHLLTYVAELEARVASLTPAKEES